MSISHAGIIDKIDGTFHPIGGRVWPPLEMVVPAMPKRYEFVGLTDGHTFECPFCTFTQPISRHHDLILGVITRCTQCAAWWMLTGWFGDTLVVYRFIQPSVYVQAFSECNRRSFLTSVLALPAPTKAVNGVLPLAEFERIYRETLQHPHIDLEDLP